MARDRQSAARAYHHGNLREALLGHAVELARTGGPDAVILRDVQRLAGVSNSAAYRHYADREALLAAVARYSLSRIADAMTTRLEAVPTRGPRTSRALARLRATGQGYVDFALAEPGLFRTAFDHDASAGESDAETADVTEHHPYRILARCLDDLVAVGVLDQARRDGLDEAAWAAVHGLATLFLDGPLSLADAKRKQLVTDRMLDVIAAGLR